MTNKTLNKAKDQMTEDLPVKEQSTCEIAGNTDVGRQRMRNEDNFLLLEKYTLSVVADGMGGHVDGNIASQIAIDTIKDRYQDQYNEIATTSEDEIFKKQEEFMVNAVLQANKNIFARNKGNFTMDGMGTTIVSLQVGDGYVLTACVGDSRIYLLRDNKLKQITEDHSLVGELVRYNIIDKKDMLFLQNKNIITRALGMTENVMVDTTKQQTQVGDIFLLCSDGLTDLVQDEEIEQLLCENQQDMVRSVELLIARANEMGGQDNITVSLVRILR